MIFQSNTSLPPIRNIIHKIRSVIKENQWQSCEIRTKRKRRGQSKNQRLNCHYRFKYYNSQRSLGNFIPMRNKTVNIGSRLSSRLSQKLKTSIKKNKVQPRPQVYTQQIKKRTRVTGKSPLLQQYARRQFESFARPASQASPEHRQAVPLNDGLSSNLSGQQRKQILKNDSQANRQTQFTPITRFRQSNAPQLGSSRQLQKQVRGQHRFHSDIKLQQTSTKQPQLKKWKQVVSRQLQQFKLVDQHIVSVNQIYDKLEKNIQSLCVVRRPKQAQIQINQCTKSKAQQIQAKPLHIVDKEQYHQQLICLKPNSELQLTPAFAPKQLLLQNKSIQIANQQIGQIKESLNQQQFNKIKQILYSSSEQQEIKQHSTNNVKKDNMNYRFDAEFKIKYSKQSELSNSYVTQEKVQTILAIDQLKLDQMQRTLRVQTAQGKVDQFQGKQLKAITELKGDSYADRQISPQLAQLQGQQQLSHNQQKVPKYQCSNLECPTILTFQLQKADGISKCQLKPGTVEQGTNTELILKVDARVLFNEDRLQQLNLPQEQIQIQIKIKDTFLQHESCLQCPQGLSDSNIPNLLDKSFLQMASESNTFVQEKRAQQVDRQVLCALDLLVEQQEPRPPATPMAVKVSVQTDELLQDQAQHKPSLERYFSSNEPSLAPHGTSPHGTTPNGVSPNNSSLTKNLKWYLTELPNGQKRAGIIKNLGTADVDDLFVFPALTLSEQFACFTDPEFKPSRNSKRLLQLCSTVTGARFDSWEKTGRLQSTCFLSPNLSSAFNAVIAIAGGWQALSRLIQDYGYCNPRGYYVVWLCSPLKHFSTIVVDDHLPQELQTCFNQQWIALTILQKALLKCYQSILQLAAASPIQLVRALLGCCTVKVKDEAVINILAQSTDWQHMLALNSQRDEVRLCLLKRRINILDQKGKHVKLLQLQTVGQKNRILVKKDKQLPFQEVYLLLYHSGCVHYWDYSPTTGENRPFLVYFTGKQNNVAISGCSSTGGKLRVLLYEQADGKYKLKVDQKAKRQFSFLSRARQTNYLLIVKGADVFAGQSFLLSILSEQSLTVNFQQFASERSQQYQCKEVNFRAIRETRKTTQETQGSPKPCQPKPGQTKPSPSKIQQLRTAKDEAIYLQD